MQKIPDGLFLHNLQYHPLLFLDNLEVIHQFFCTVKISSQAILQIWESKSGAGADPNPFKNLMIFDLHAVVSNFPVKVEHCLIVSASRFLFFLRHLRL